MQTLQKFFETIKVPRLAELQCSAYLARAAGDVPTAKALSEADRMILEPADWTAAVLYARRMGVQVFNAD